MDYILLLPHNPVGICIFYKFIIGVTIKGYNNPLSIMVILIKYSVGLAELFYHISYEESIVKFEFS